MWHRHDDKNIEPMLNKNKNKTQNVASQTLVTYTHTETMHAKETLWVRWGQWMILPGRDTVWKQTANEKLTLLMNAMMLLTKWNLVETTLNGWYYGIWHWQLNDRQSSVVTVTTGIKRRWCQANIVKPLVKWQCKWYGWEQSLTDCGAAPSK